MRALATRLRVAIVTVVAGFFAYCYRKFLPDRLLVCGLSITGDVRRETHHEARLVKPATPLFPQIPK
eukprot:987229-Amphidinium_carterae.1